MNDYESRQYVTTQKLIMIYTHSSRLWTLLFTNAPDPDDVGRWTSQQFVFSESQPVILKQIHGGPCGVLAPVQAFIVKELLFGHHPGVASVHALKQISHEDAQDVLLGVLISIMSRALISAEEPLVFLKLAANHEFEVTDGFDVATMTVLDFLASVVASRGIDNVLADMDDIENPFIGRFGHCSQEVLNLMLFGIASSNVFDREHPMGDTGMVLRGVPEDACIEVGLLSELEALRYVTVGSKFKKPDFPVWILGTTSHYTVMFGFDKDATDLGQSDPIRAFVSSKMSDVQFDEGLMMADRVDDLLSSLGLTAEKATAQSAIVKEGIVILEDVVTWARPFLSIKPEFTPSPPTTTRKELEMYLINTQIPQTIYKVLVSKTGVSATGGTDIGGNLGSILQTRWPGTHVSVSQA